MTDSNRAEEAPATDDAPLTFDAGVDALADLMTDSEDPNPGKKVEAKTDEAETEADEPEAEAEGEGAEDEADDEEAIEPTEEEGGPEEIKGGQFAPNTAKVTLPDGTVTTVENLRRGFMSQQSFTRGTQENAAKRKELEAAEANLINTAKALKQQRDFLLQYGQRKLPKAPDRELMNSDPIGYMQAKADYEDEVRAIQQLAFQRKSETGRLTEAEKKQVEQRRAQEAERLMEVMPELRQPKTYETFWTDASNTIAEKYGYSAQELAKVATDHRLYPMMRDLVKYHKALKGTEKVKQDIQAKPKVMGASRRMDPKAKTSREVQARRDQLAKTGSFEAGVASLMDLDF